MMKGLVIERYRKLIQKIIRHKILSGDQDVHRVLTQQDFL